MSYILDIAKNASITPLRPPASPKHAKRPSLDIRSIPQIIALIKLKAVTEESKLAEAARDA